MTIRIAALLAVLALAIPFAACGDDDEESGGSDPTTVASDVERYCDITVELDQAGSEEFEALEEDPDATEADYEAAERNLIEDNTELLAEIAEVAPDEIRADVETVIAALEQRAGISDEEVPNAEVAAAEKNLKAFEAENCDPAEEAP